MREKECLEDWRSHCAAAVAAGIEAHGAGRTRMG
jgi:hypothetical protein